MLSESSRQMNLPTRWPFTQLPYERRPSFYSKKWPFLMSMSHVPSQTSLRLLFTYLPFPFFLFSMKEPSKVSPFAQVILPYPSILSFLKLPIYSKESLPLLRVSLPCPSFFPATNSPQYTSPFPYLSTPLPWNFPPWKVPSQILSLQWYFPVPTFSLFLNYPQQTVPFASFNIPCPSFFPFTKWPQYSVLFLKLCSFPKPWNSSAWNSPSYSATPFRKYSPFPSFIPPLNPPLQRNPALDQNVPVLKSSSSNSPVNLSPSAKQNSQLLPCFFPFAMVPMNLEPSAQATSPFVNCPCSKMPLKVPLLASFHTPSPWAQFLSLKSPSQQSPFLRVSFP